MQKNKYIRAVLTIAGSDSCCGAGIQADLKTFQRYGVYGVCAVTAVTAQDGSRVDAVFPLPPRAVSSQVEAVLRAACVCGVKTGMLWNEGTIRAVAKSIALHSLGPLVVDPVITSHAGRRLLAHGAEKALVRHLFPLADLVTPNILEAERLTGIAIAGERDILRAARRLIALGPRAVLITGGHAPGPAADWFYDGTALSIFTADRIRGGRLHGSGCILSAAIVAGMAKGMTVTQAIELGKHYVRRQIELSCGAGGVPPLAPHS